MKEKLSFSLFYVGLLSALVAMLVTSGAFRSTISEQTSLDLKLEGDLVANAYAFLDSFEDLSRFASPTLRVTLISPTGKVLFESDAEKDSMDSHILRPEVKAAIKTGEGYSHRASHTIDSDVYYYAKTLSDGNILRLSIRKSNAFAVLSSVYPRLFALLVVLLLLSFFFAHILSARFVEPIRRLAENLDSVKFPEGDIVYKEFAPFAREIKRQRDNADRELSRLKFEQNRFRTLIEDMSEGMILLDANGEIVMVNGVAREMFLAKGEFSGCRIGDFSSNASLTAAVAEASNGKKSDAEIRLAGKDIRLIASPVEVGGEVSGIIVILLDITEKKNLSDLREMFTANVSHELKTPLTSIAGYAEMVEKGIAKPEDVPGFAARIHKESERLLSLTNDIMRLSELDESSGELPNAEMVHLPELLDDVKTSLEPLSQKRNVTIEISTIPFDLRGDRDKLYELFYNLMQNAIRYNRENGSVRIFAEDRSVIVEDSGVGIPEEHLPHIFERFYRVDKSRSRETGGTGLGLAIVKHIAELHKAKISVSSEPGKGSRFKVEFPLAAIVDCKIPCKDF